VLAGSANGKERPRGINTLLHGGVGTGKTEFCKTLAAEAGMTIWSVGEADDAGGEPQCIERLAALRMAQRLLTKRARSLILSDEAEDVWSSQPVRFRPRERSGSNRLLEESRVPVLWTCNDVGSIDPAPAA
jgi:transitional endoplasmic reticulum ATPase